MIIVPWKTVNIRGKLRFYLSIRIVIIFLLRGIVIILLPHASWTL